MRYMFLGLCLFILPLSGCVSPSLQSGTGKNVLAEDWVDGVKAEDATQPECSFRADGVGGCHLQ